MKLKYNIDKTPDAIPVYTLAQLFNTYLFTNSQGICTFILKDDTQQKDADQKVSVNGETINVFPLSALKDGVKIEIDCQNPIEDVNISRPGQKEGSIQVVTSFKVINTYADSIKVNNINDLIDTEIDFEEVDDQVEKYIRILDPNIQVVEFSISDETSSASGKSSKGVLAIPASILRQQEMQKQIPLVIRANRGTQELSEPLVMTKTINILVPTVLDDPLNQEPNVIGSFTVKATFI